MKDKPKKFITNIFLVCVPFVVPVVALIVLTNSTNIKAFFAPSPKAKCEVYLSSDDKDNYCKEDGTKGSKVEDEKRACITKSPYFSWDDKANVCVRIKYTSKDECEKDGRAGVKITPDNDTYYVRCKDGGTWEAYNLEHEEYATE